MSKAALQSLETCRLAEYAVPIPCYICEADNTFEAEFCHSCLAPMALAHQAAGRKTRPRMVAVMGPSGAGKTVYLGMLMDMLSRQPERMQFLARGAFSISLQQTTVSALARCEFPQKTCNEPDRWNWVHCQIRRGNQGNATELVMPDMAGDALLEEVDHPHTFRIIRAFLQKSTGAMVLIDAIQLREGAREQDYFTMKLLSYLSELDDHTRHGWSRRPVAVILSKADQADECRKDPAGFAKAHAAGLWRHCRERFQCHRFFAVGVAGACAWLDTATRGRCQVPLLIEPHGIVEPFEWLLDQLAKTKA
jgi:hypothetical protein